jgi:hypothetical protein
MNEKLLKLVRADIKEKTDLAIERNSIRPKKLPFATGILTPPSIIRGTMDWFFIRGRSEVNFKFCMWHE